MAAPFPSLEAEWKASLFFEAKGPSAGFQFLPQSDKIALGAFKAQALHGPATEAMASAPSFEGVDQRLRREAWAALGDMPKQTAQRRFLSLMRKAFPDWPEWYRVHGHQHALRMSASSPTDSEGGPCATPMATGKDLSTAGSNSDSLSDQILRDFQRKTGLVLQQASKL